MTNYCYLCKSKKKNISKYGDFLTKSGISVHYYCLLLTSNLVQDGRDDQGFAGFLAKDIKLVASRIASKVCCYCNNKSANISCGFKNCSRSFHLQCGTEHGALNKFVDSYQSFCHRHIPRSMSVKERPAAGELCSICYDDLGAYNRLNVIPAPCCHNGWFHKLCLAKFANNAGYFFKCPLCNNIDTFRQKLPFQGIFIPNQDAAWELEPNAFSELLERPDTCSAKKCNCPEGRQSTSLKNNLIFCNTCGSQAIHRRCLAWKRSEFTCADCAGLSSSNLGIGHSLDDISVCGHSSNDRGSGAENDDAQIGRRNGGNAKSIPESDDEDILDQSNIEIRVMRRRRLAPQIEWNQEDEKTNKAEMEQDSALISALASNNFAKKLKLRMESLVSPNAKEVKQSTPFSERTQNCKRTLDSDGAYSNWTPKRSKTETKHGPGPKSWTQSHDSESAEVGDRSRAVEERSTINKYRPGPKSRTQSPASTSSIVEVVKNRARSKSRAAEQLCASGSSLSRTTKNRSQSGARDNNRQVKHRIGPKSRTHWSPSADSLTPLDHQSPKKHRIGPKSRTQNSSSADWSTSMDYQSPKKHRIGPKSRTQNSSSADWSTSMDY